VLPEDTGEIVVAGFVGRICEPVERHRGLPSPVAPLSTIGKGPLMSWLGFHEVWENKPRNTCIFHHISLTVHLGYQGDPIKPQVFRSEWAGVRGWQPGVVGFQSPGAGHPHWQFDAMRSVRDVDASQKNKSLARLKEEITSEEFDPTTMTQNILTDFQAVALERIHFASAAPWWLPSNNESQAPHMNAPSDPNALMRWTLACVMYIRQELRRC
jgi:hypothetical protein